MQKLIRWCKDRWLVSASLFLLAFIPLYPKLPLVDIRNTWVYIRAEDFVVLFFLCCWGVLFFRRKVTLKTPLTMPILLFWLVGGIATLHSILLLYPSVSEIFPTVSFLSFVRRMEYMSLFFVAYSSVKDKRALTAVITTLLVTLFVVSIYGIGQKYIGLPAFLTMNEEFAKGMPIRLSALSRVSSTFGGHYDLAAYLVLVIPILVSVMFGYRSLLVRAAIGVISLLGVLVLFMTVSRISVFALFLALGIILFFQRRKLVFMLMPIVVLGGAVFLAVSPSLLQRFGSTVKTVDVLVDAQTGRDMGHVQDVPNTYFQDKVVNQRFYLKISDIDSSASPSSAFIIPYEALPPTVTVLVEPAASTGEDLPSGTGYINLALSPDVKKIGSFLYEPKSESASSSSSSAEVFVINGEYLVKRAAAYDISFTTRFQGEWPKALAAFRRNVLFGSGYGSVSLAVDNSYLRMLGEVGALGFAAFAAIFLIIGLSIVAAWPKLTSPVARSFVLGFAAGVVGLMVNGIFIDVFEASKVAFVLWLLAGLVMGFVRLYQRVPFRVYKELTKAMTSTAAIVVYLGIATVLLFSPITRNFFVGDDFTWLRWAAECENAAANCPPIATRILHYFTQSNGFFYRPGMKTYFLGMYQLFWLNQTVYHAVSLVLHFAMSVWVFLLARRVFGKKAQSALAAFLFLGLSGFSESVFWISASGFLFASNCILVSLISYISWRERGSRIYVVAALLSFVFSLSFHELGVVTPFLFLLYEWVLASDPSSFAVLRKKASYWVLFSPLLLYAVMRYLAHSHWLSGDYNYNIIKFPLNMAGNLLGYSALAFAGPYTLPLYEAVRTVLRTHMALSAVVMAAAALCGVYAVRKIWKTISVRDRRVLLFAVGFFVIALLPFLGLGNAASRYSYLASVGAIIFLVYGVEKLYGFLLASGRNIAISGVLVFVCVFGLWHVVMIQIEHHDWYHAGQKVQKFVVALDDSYENEWASDAMKLYFVNVPIRFGDAWIFPVGLRDALWFVYRNPQLQVFTPSSLQSALDTVDYDSKTQKIFVFDSEGMVSEVKKPAPILP